MAQTDGQRLPRQLKPPPTLTGLAAMVQEVFLDLQRTSETLKAGVEELVRPHGLSFTQYNALRILRNAGMEGATCQHIIDRMVTRDPDMTRLLDRLQHRGLVARERSQKDRRVVQCYLTEAGSQLLESLDDEVVELHIKQLGHIGLERLRAFGDILGTIREAVPARSLGD